MESMATIIWEEMFKQSYALQFPEAEIWLFGAMFYKVILSKS